ncbi:MAG TPA: DUF3450 family protein [Fibrobacteraceae bacterium]|nr:DUF3450 family protein [Fibrobacteraceae bacterium]
MNLKSTLIRSAFLLAICAPWTWADLQAELDDYRSQKSALQAEIKKLDHRASQTDSIAKDEAKRFETTQKRQQEDLLRRQAELDTMQVRIAALAQEQQTEKGQQNAYQLQAENAKAFRIGLARNLARLAQELETLVAQSLPWDRESRLERIRALRHDLENGNAGPDEGLIRLRAIYSEEIRFGDEVVILNKPMTRQNGETVNARLLRIGNQWMMYTDEEEGKYGILIRTRKPEGGVDYTWREELSFEERAAVKLAIDVKLARKPPQMVRLPLSLTLPSIPGEKKP